MAIAVFANVDGRSVNQTVPGILEAARERDLKVVVFSSPTLRVHNELSERHLRPWYTFNPAEFEGIIMAYPAADMLTYAARLRRGGLPVVAIARPGAVPSIVVDNFGAVRRATQAFLNAGHRKICFVAGPEGNLSAEPRRLGFLSAIRDAGLPAEVGLILKGDFTTTIAQEAVLAAWQAGHRFTALVAANDDSAIGALRALQSVGVSVPNEVEVVGFDDVPPAKWTTPPLASFAVSDFEMGRRAVEHLLSGEPTNLVLPVTFVRRASVRARTPFEVEATLPEPWAVHPEVAARQLAFLRHDERTAACLTRLEESGAKSTRFLADLGRLIEGCRLLDLNAGILLTLLDERRADDASEASAIRRGTLQVIAAAFQQQQQHGETASEFDIAARRLRLFAVEPADEMTILKSFVATLQFLQIRNATLWLRDMDAHGAIRSEYRLTVEAASLVSAVGPRQFSVVEHLQSMAAARGLFVGPLLNKDDCFGVLLLDLDSPFRPFYPELLRQLTIAIQSARNGVLLDRAHQALLDVSHHAGRADVAAAVLHSVGNVLNSLNVSTQVAVGTARSMKIDSLLKVSQLLAQAVPQASENSKLQRVPQFVEAVANALASDRDRIISELAMVSDGVERITHVVSSQQAKTSRTLVFADIDPQTLIDDAIAIAIEDPVAKSVTVVRDYAASPRAHVCRSKALQVTTTLIQYALRACQRGGRAPGVLTFQIRPDAGRVLIALRHNGEPIDADRIQHLFAQDAKSDEPLALELHLAAVAAKELGAQLTAERLEDGSVGFTLNLPAAKETGGTLGPAGAGSR